MSPVEAVIVVALFVVVMINAAQYAQGREIRRGLERLSRGDGARRMLGRGDVRAAVPGEGESPATRPLGSVGALSLPHYPDPVRLPPITIDEPPDSDKAAELPQLGPDADVGAPPSLDKIVAALDAADNMRADQAPEPPSGRSGSAPRQRRRGAHGA